MSNDNEHLPFTINWQKKVLADNYFLIYIMALYWLNYFKSVYNHVMI